MVERRSAKRWGVTVLNGRLPMLSDVEFSAESSADAQVLTSRLMSMGVNVDRIPSQLSVKVVGRGRIEEGSLIDTIEEVMSRRISTGRRRAELRVLALGVLPTPKDRSDGLAADLEDLGFEVEQSDRRKKDVSVKAKKKGRGRGDRGVAVQEIIDLLRRRPDRPGPPDEPGQPDEPGRPDRDGDRNGEPSEPGLGRRVEGESNGG